MVEMPKTLTPRQFVKAKYPKATCIFADGFWFQIRVVSACGNTALIGVGSSRKQAWADAARITKKVAA